jgi:hypothetical protein
LVAGLGGHVGPTGDGQHYAYRAVGHLGHRCGYHPARDRSDGWLADLDSKSGQGDDADPFTGQDHHGGGNFPTFDFIAAPILLVVVPGRSGSDMSAIGDIGVVAGIFDHCHPVRA